MIMLIAVMKTEQPVKVVVAVRKEKSPGMYLKFNASCGEMKWNSKATHTHS